MSAAAAGVPPVVDLGRDEARRRAQEELSRPEYDAAQPPLLVRLLERVLRELLELLDRASGAVPGGRTSLLLLLAVVLLVAAAVVARIGPLGGRGARGPAVLGGDVLSADAHRARADAAAAAGDWAQAVRERLRAVVRELEARGVLDPRPGRTADEVARDAGAVVPHLAEPLRAAATAFDEIWYGGRPATAEAHSVVVAVDEQVRSTSLAVA